MVSSQHTHLGKQWSKLKRQPIFAQMGIDSTRLAFDGLIKQEFGRRSGSSDCSLMKNVLHQVKGIIQGGEISTEPDTKLEVARCIPSPNGSNANEMSTSTSSGQNPRSQQYQGYPQRISTYLSRAKACPRGASTCADFVDRLIRLPSSSWTDNFLLNDIPFNTKLCAEDCAAPYPAIESKWRPRVFAILKKWTQSTPTTFGDPTESNTVERALYPSLTPSDKDFHSIEVPPARATTRRDSAANNRQRRGSTCTPGCSRTPRASMIMQEIMNWLGVPGNGHELTLVAQDRL